MLIDTRIKIIVAGSIRCFHITIHIQVSSAETAVAMTEAAHSFNKKNILLLLYLLININVPKKSGFN